MKKVIWKPIMMFGLMIIVMFGLMTLFSFMLGGGHPMVFSVKGPGMWGAMIPPFAGIIIMFIIMFFFFRLMAGRRGPMSMMMGRRDDPKLQGENINLETLSFNIPAMNCTHCKMKIEQAMGNLPGVALVDVDLDTKQAVIKLFSLPTRTEMESLLTEIGYPPEIQ